MAKLTEYPQVTDFDSGDILVKDGTNGTKKILFQDVFDIATRGVAKKFSTSENYYAGDYIYYDRVLYRFTADHLKTAWTGNDAEEVKLGSNLYSAFDNLGCLNGLLKEDSTLISADDFTLGKYLRYSDGASSGSVSYMYAGFLSGVDIAAFEFNDPDYTFWVSYFNASGYIGSASSTYGYTGHSTSIGNVVGDITFIPKQAEKFAITFHRIDGEATTSTDVNNVLAALKIYKNDISGREISFECVLGLWNASFNNTSAPGDNTIRMRQPYPMTDFYIYSEDNYKYAIRFGIVRVTAAQSPAYVSYRTTPTVIHCKDYPNMDARLFAINIQKPDESEFASDEEIALAASKVHIISIDTDMALNAVGIPADSFAVGSLIGNANPVTKAVRNYTAGEFIALRGNLYKATQNISEGTALSTSTNIELTSIAEQLTALWTAISNL